jgi:dipeptidyl aminopeptidase/acylaminoacyl peptidase
MSLQEESRMIRVRQNVLMIFIIIFSYLLTPALQAENRAMPDASALIPRRLLFGNPEKTTPKLSPDGNLLAYLAPDAQGVLNVWVRDLERPERGRQVTKEQKCGVRSFFWQYDSQAILYLQDKEGDENSHLYHTRLDTQVIKDLTPYEGVKVNILAYDFRWPFELLIEMNRRDPSSFDVYCLNLQTGSLTLDTENSGEVIAWIVDHDLHVRGCKSYTADGSTLIRVRDQASSPWRDWLTISPMEDSLIEEFTADGQWMVLIANLGVDKARLLQIHLTTGKQIILAEDSHYDLADLLIHPQTHALQAVGVERERYEWIVLDPSLVTDFNYLKQTLKGSFAISSVDLANRKWIVVSESDQRPLHFYLYDRSTKELTFLFCSQPELEHYSLRPMQPITFQARDGMTLHGYLTLPLKRESDRIPAILLVHGGPWGRDSWGMCPTVQWLANRGYAVLQINFRGSTGYGKTYLNAGNREWAGKMHTDLLDGKEWLVQQGHADPERVAIFGGSYGGYATLVGLTFTPEAFCCGVDIVGPSNLVTLLKTFPPYWKPLQVQMDLRVGKLETEEEFLKLRSPLFKAEPIKKPLLIAQGANDPRVKQAESDQIVAAMRQKALPVDYLLFTDEGHGFARPENRLKFFAAAETFLARHLGGRQELPHEEESWESVKR